MQCAPLSELPGIPEQGVQFARPDIVNTQVVAAQRGDADRFLVGGAHGGRPVVGLYIAPDILVVDREEPSLAAALLARQRFRQGERGDAHIGQGIAAVQVEHAPRRKRAQQRDIRRLLVRRELEAVEAAPDIREAEGADQPLRDAVLFEPGQGGIGRESSRRRRCIRSGRVSAPDRAGSDL